jgi:uncharacterized Zn-finger protein
LHRNPPIILREKPMTSSHTASVGILGAPGDRSCPQFRNDDGVKAIRIGVKEFECIGETPPQDHPHIYLEIGDQNRILCPYRSTVFWFDTSLETYESIPAECLFHGS